MCERVGKQAFTCTKLTWVVLNKRHCSSVDSPRTPKGVPVNGRDVRVPNSAVEAKPLAILAILSALSMEQAIDVAMCK